jgi:hypothetical protein
MKKLLFVLLGMVCFVNTNAQIAQLSLTPNLDSTNINGSTIINKGDTVKLTLSYLNNKSSLRNFYLDFQHQITALSLIDVTFPISGAENSALPQGSTATYQNNYYPGYYWNRNANNTTEDGLTNYLYSSYGYTSGGIKSINRIYLQFATNGGNNTNLKDGDLCYLRFKVMETSAGFSYDSIYYNFAYGYDVSGVQRTIKMPKPNSSWVNVSKTSNALINGTLQINQNLSSTYQPIVIIVDSLTNIVKATLPVSYNGSFTLSSEVSPNTSYKAYVAIKNNDIPYTLWNAITISDYVTAASEFVKQNLDGTYTNSNMKSGMTWLASDVNQDKKFDGADLNLLFAQAVGDDTIFTSNTSQYWNLYAFDATKFDTTTYNSWQTLSNLYYVPFKTGTTAKDLKIKYLIPGDINRSHSSQVETTSGVVTNAKVNLKLGDIKSIANGVNISNTVTDINTINVSLNNLTVTSNNIQIPIAINTNKNDLSAIQFEFVYDTTSVKFDEVQTNLDSHWVIFINNKLGKVRFVAIDKQFKYPINGDFTPFVLKFTSLQNGLDLQTTIKICNNYDASDSNGNQIDINLNKSSIKLTGYNKF